MTEDSTNPKPTTSEPDADAKTAPMPPLAADKRSALPDPSRRQGTSRIAVGILIVGLAIGGGWWWYGRDSGRAPKPPEKAAAPASKPDIAAKPDDAPKPADAPPAKPPTAVDSAAPTKPADGPASPKPADTATPAIKPPEPPPATAAGDPAKPAPAPVENQDDALRRLAEAGNVDAMEELGRRYIQGAGVAPDAAEGARWMLRAADKGSPRAMFNAGVMFERGFELPKDTVKAVEWYRKAAAAGVPMAQHNLALLMRDGNGTKADPVGSFEMMRSAARQGVPNSMLALAIMHELGQGTRRDNVAAIVWYAMAAQFAKFAEGDSSDVHRTAATKQADLTKRLPPADLQRAQTIGESEYKTIIDNMRVAARATPPATPGPANPPGAAAPDLPIKTVKPIDAREQLVEIQKMLFALKFYNGPPDGIIGPGTTAAIRAFQKSAGLPVNGEVSRDLFDLLRNVVKSTGAK